MIGLFYARKSLGAMIKIQQTLQVLSASHNRMGHFGKCSNSHES
jgi:hypothetical protein